MIAYPRSDTSSESLEPPSVRIIGLGNAGVHLADRLQMNGHADVVVMNTDAQSLLSSIAAKKITLGQKTTYGLGAGGDPEVGFEAAQESRGDIRSAVEGANIVFLCAGLGGRHSLRSRSNSGADRAGNRSSSLLNCHLPVQLRGPPPLQTVG